MRWEGRAGDAIGTAERPPSMYSRTKAVPRHDGHRTSHWRRAAVVVLLAATLLAGGVDAQVARDPHRTPVTVHPAVSQTDRELLLRHAQEARLATVFPVDLTWGLQ